MKQRVVQFLLWLDYQTEGIRLRLFVMAAVVQVFLAPLWDSYLPFDRVAARMEPMTLLATLNFLFWGFALLGGRLLALSSLEDPSSENRAPHLLRRSFVTLKFLMTRYVRLVRLEPWPVFLARIGAGVCVALMALRGAAGLVRWGLWKGMRTVEDFWGRAKFESMRSGLTWVYHQEQSVLKGVVLCSIPLSVLAAWSFLHKGRRNLRPSSLSRLDALAGIDPLLERREHTSHEPVWSAFNGELVKKVLQALSTWTPSKRVQDEGSCRDELGDYLHGCGCEARLERWIADDLERRRIDILVEEAILIEIKFELHEKGAGEQDRARAQIEQYARMWKNTGPVILFLACTPRDKAQRFADFATKWNAKMEDDVSPVLIVTDTPLDRGQRDAA